MNEYVIKIPTVLNFPMDFTGERSITYNCPFCDLEIEIDMILEENSSLECENCDCKFKFEIVRV